jgi:tetratricopeptide (TPR) repeat protein
VEARLALADYHYDLREFATAIPHAAAAVAAAPDSARARTALGRALVREGRHAEGLAQLAPVVAADPDGHQATAWLFAGVAEAGLGRPAEAAATLRRYLEFRPDEPRARHDLVAALRAAGDLAEADRHARWLAGRTAAERLAEGAHWAEGQPRDFALAETRWRAAIAAYPFEAEWHKRLFLLLRQQGRFADALDALRAMRATFPQSRWAANYLAFMAELEVRRGAAPAPAALLAEAAEALSATWPYEEHGFARDDLRARAAELRAWAAAEAGRR